MEILGFCYLDISIIFFYIIFFILEARNVYYNLFINITLTQYLVMVLKKGFILILSLVIIVLGVSCVSAGLFDGLFGGDNKNITLTNESTSGWVEIHDDGSIQSCYMVDGVFEDLPSNVEGYNLKVALYDENGKLLKEADGSPMKGVAKASEKSNPTKLCFIGLEKNVNISVAEVKLYNPEGDVVLDKNVTFSMENVSIKHISKSTSDTDDADDDSSSYTYGKYSPKNEMELYTNQMREEQSKGTYFNPPK